MVKTGLQQEVGKRIGLYYSFIEIFQSCFSVILRARIICLVIILLFTIKTGLCSTYVQVGIASNFLIIDGRVYFAQSDDTLTVLDLETGGVVTRKSNIEYGGTLEIIDMGILMFTYRKITLLNQNTLEVVWQTKDEYNPIYEGNRLISYDGNGLVKCRELSSGRIHWSYNLSGALDLVVQKGKVLVFREALYDGPEGVTAVVLLNIESGQELMHKTTPPNLHYLGAYFDGDWIYLPTGSYKYEKGPNLSRYDTGRPTACFEKLLVWDLSGREIDSIPAPERLKKKNLRQNETFTLNNKIFAHGRVWENPKKIISFQNKGYGRIVKKSPMEDYDREVNITHFDIDDGSVIITSTLNFDPKAEKIVDVELRSSMDSWQGRLPYLKGMGEITVVGATEEKLLLGSNIGHVEAIDRKTGESKWMYIFPTIRRTMSYSSYGMTPMMAKAAELYKMENRNKEPESGLMLEPENEFSRPIIVFDPQPATPYKKLPIFLIIAWIGAVIPILMTTIVVVFCQKRQLNPRIPSILTLLFAIGATYCFIFYGRVSMASAFGLQISMAVSSVVAAFYAIRALYRRHWISGTLIILAVSMLGVIIFHNFWLFCLSICFQLF